METGEYDFISDCQPERRRYGEIYSYGSDQLDGQRERENVKQGRDEVVDGLGINYVFMRSWL